MPTETGASQKILSYASRLPSLPATALEVVRLSKQEWVALDEMAAIIVRDPALSGRLLKLANSPLYLRRRPSATIQDAFRTLGLKAVRMAALSFSVVGMASAKEGFRGFDLKSFWRRAIVQSVFAKILSKSAGKGLDDEAFTLGLLVDVAVPLLCRYGGAEYAALIPSMDAGHPDRGAERDATGMSHDELAGRLLLDWGLPDEMCIAAEFHHDADGAPSGGPGAAAGVDLARLLQLAHLAASIVVSPNKGLPLRRLNACAAAWFGFDEARVQALLAEAGPNIELVAGVVDVDIGGPVEIEDLLSDARSQLMLMSLSANSEAEKAREKAAVAERKAGVDVLTGLANRATFDAALGDEWEARRKERGAGPLALILADIDHFKKVNDTHGHPAGDAVLRTVAAAMKKSARTDDVVCRYGGEEFVIVVPGADLANARTLAERLRRAVERSETTIGDKSLRVTASFGCVALTDEPGDRTPAQFVSAADRALYAAKAAGRDRVEASPEF